MLPSDSSKSDNTPLVNVKISWLKIFMLDRLLKELICIIDNVIIKNPTKIDDFNFEILNLCEV
jgi:hypothetical protein